MTITAINNLFSQEEIISLQEAVDNLDISEQDEILGRIQASIFNVPDNVAQKINQVINTIEGGLVRSSVLYVEYNNKYGQPNLPPHFDGDNTELIIDFQLSSNISWDLGLNTTLYPLKDNDAVILSPNKDIHWRPHRVFNDGEYVKMIFFRFIKQSGESDYSNMRYSQDHPIFKDAREFRDSL